MHKVEITYPDGNKMRFTLTAPSGPTELPRVLRNVAAEVEADHIKRGEIKTTASDAAMEKTVERLGMHLDRHNYDNAVEVWRAAVEWMTKGEQS